VAQMPSNPSAGKKKDRQKSFGRKSFLLINFRLVLPLPYTRKAKKQ
jgi:hypothetical protein